MSAQEAEEVVQDLSFPVKVYVGIVHLLLLFLVVLFLQRPRKNGDKANEKGKSRTFTKDDRAVTIESCEWINSTLAWFYLHAQNNEDKDRTPHIVKLWLRALNKQLQKDKKKDQRIVIESLSPGCLPPKLTSVYCLCVSGNMQCITFHVESSDLGFLVRVLQQADNGYKTTHLETRVVKLTGEVALKLSTAPSRLEVSVQFIGVPQIAMATKCLAKLDLFIRTDIASAALDCIPLLKGKMPAPMRGDHEPYDHKVFASWFKCQSKPVKPVRIIISAILVFLLMVCAITYCCKKRRDTKKLEVKPPSYDEAVTWNGTPGQ